MRPWTRKFLWRTLQHKWFVLLAGLKTGAPLWRLVIHDWSKFLPSEAPHYGRQYYGPKDQRWAYERAQLLHFRRNDHHWQYWVHCEFSVPFVMSEGAAREMVADWLAACRTQGGHWPTSDWPWLEQHWAEIELHPVTRQLVTSILRDVSVLASPVPSR